MNNGDTDKLKKLIFFLTLSIAILVILLAIALSDNEARPAIGERRVAISADAEIHYFSRGADAGRPVILLPSYARSASDFNELVQVLNREGFRTISIQPRGVDGSTLPSLDITYHTNAADVAAVLDEEKISASVSIIGHAYGNRIARTFATDYPSRSHQLILLAAGGEAPTPPEVSSAIFKALFGIFPESVRREAVAYAFFAKGNLVPKHWLQGWYPMAGLSQGNATAAASTERTNPRWGDGGDDQLFILQPAEDAAAAHGAASLLERFPDRVEIHFVEKAGHAILPEQRDKVGTLVLQALKQG